MTEMNCKICAEWLHPYLDNELGTEMAIQAYAHLKTCSACKTELQNLKALKIGIKQHASYHTAPELLRKHIEKQYAAKTSSSWLLPSASLIALAASVALFFLAPMQQDAFIDEVVSSHVRSLMEQHLTDVASSDKHTVKPWFAGRIDFSPPVYDLADKGFPLFGGRLDYIKHQNTAALSYGRNKHIINLFIAPTSLPDALAQSKSERGYNVIYWRQNHMAFEAVSDLNLQELGMFSDLIAKHP